MGYLTNIDIANRALQHVGAMRIASFQDNSKQAAEAGFCYDKVRAAELRSRVWRFAIRRAVLRALTATTKRFIAPAWVTTTSYSIGTVVQDSLGTYWVCMVAHTASTTNAPGTVAVGQPQYWQQYFGPLYGDAYSSSVSYYAGELVYVAGSPDAWFLSLPPAGNAANATSSTSFWCPQTGATDLPVNFLVAAGPGVSILNVARNLFPLPNGYLRVAPQDPKTPSTSNNVTSAGLRVLDWEFEGSYIVTAQPGPLIFRFVADISDVTMMDGAFCEGLAARMAYELCETLTQSNIKLQAVGQTYQAWIETARNINWLELGSTEPQEQRYELTRGPAGVVDQVPQGGEANAGSPEDR